MRDFMVYASLNTVRIRVKCIHLDTRNVADAIRRKKLSATVVDNVSLRDNHDYVNFSLSDGEGQHN